MNTRKFSTRIIVLGIIMISLACCSDKKNDSNADKSMKKISEELAGMKTYLIEYESNIASQGFISKVKTIQWMDVKNDLLAMESETVTEMMGTKNIEKSLVIIDKEWTYTIDLNNQTGIKTKNEEVEDSPADMILSEDDITFREMIEKEGGVISGTESFLGKNCIVAELSQINENGNALSTKMWYYKGIPLKMINDSYTMVATKFEENIRIPDSKFEVPKNIKITELSM